MENFICKKRIGVCLVCLCLVIGCLIWKTGNTYAKEDAESSETAVKVEVVIGYDGGKVRYHRDNRAVATVTNISSKKIDGVLKLYLPTNSEDGVTAIEQEVHVEPKEKVEVDLSFRSADIYRMVTVVLEDANGKTITEKKTVVKRLSSVNIVYGILSKNAGDLSYFSKEDYGEDIVFSEKDFPERKEWLNIVDVLLLEDCQLWTLSKEQQVALTDWVKDGGTVVIGNGADSVRNLNVLGIKVKESKQDELVVDGVSGTYYKHADMTMYPVKYSRGSYVVCSKSLEFSDTDLVKKSACLAAAKTYYGKNAKLVLAKDYSGEGYYGESTSFVEKEHFPLIWWVVVLLIIYVILITVGLRLVLKRKDRLEYIWVLIPIFAFSFMGIVYIIGLHSKVTNIQMSYHTVVEYEEDSDMGNAMSCISFVNPSNQTYEVEIPDGMTVWNADAYEDGFEIMTKNIQKEVEINKGKETITFQGNTLFERNNLYGEYDVDKTGNYESAITCKNYKYNGTFTNHMGVTMKNACFVAGKRVYYVGNIKDGETVKISENTKNALLYNAQDLYENIQARKWLSFGGKERKYGDMYGYLVAVSNYFNNASCSNRIIEPKMIYVTEKENKINRQWGVEDMDGYTLNVLNIDVDYTQKEGTFVCDILCSEYADQWYPYVDNELASDSVITCRLGENETLTSLKYLEKPNDFGKDKIVLEEKMNSLPFDGKILLYNFQTADFETVFIQPGQELTEKELAPYIGEDNQIKIQLELDSENIEEEYIWRYAPVISATVKEAE